VQYGELQVSIPPGWQVLTDGECPGKAETVLLGQPSETTCPPLDGSREWIWITSPSTRLPEELATCTTSLWYGAMDVCSTGSAGQEWDTWFVPKAKAAVIAPFGHEAAYQVVRSMRYAPGVEPDVAGSG